MPIGAGHPLDTLKQCVEPNAATNLRFRTTYQN
jgi:hypothetical protein